MRGSGGTLRKAFLEQILGSAVAEMSKEKQEEEKREKQRLNIVQSWTIPAQSNGFFMMIQAK